MRKSKFLAVFTVVAVVMALFGGIHGLSQTVSAEENVKWDNSKAYNVTKQNAAYHAFLSTDKKSAWIYKVDVSKKTKTLSFPEKVEGADVTRIGFNEMAYGDDIEDMEFRQNVFGETIEFAHNCDGYKSRMKNITTVSLPGTLTSLDATALSGLRYVKNIKIPKGVKKINEETFYGCKSLEKIILPESMEYMDTYTAFYNCPKLKTIKLSKQCKKYKVKNGLVLSKNGKKLYFAAPAKKTVKVPDSVETIEEKALYNSQATKLILGKNVKKVQSQALSGKKITKVQIHKKNKVLKRDGQCIYYKKNHSLVLGIVKNKELKISDKVYEISENNTSLCGARTVKKLDISAKVKRLKGNWESFIKEGAKTVYFRGKKPPELVKNSKDGEYYLPVFKPVYVPKSAYNTYKKWYKKYHCWEYAELKK